MMVVVVIVLFSNFISIEYFTKAKALDVYTTKNMVVSCDYTKIEIIKKFATENNITLEEAKKILFSSQKNEDRYAYSYRTISKNVGYDTTLCFYTQGDGWNNYYAINKILSVSVKHNSKSFAGHVYSNIEDNVTIYYDIEGNLLNQGSTTVSAGVNFDIGHGGGVNLGSSYSTDVYAHISDLGRIVV